MTAHEDGAVLNKTRDLCQAILDDPEFKAIRRRIDTFMADPAIQVEYQELSEMGAILRRKQQRGEDHDPAELDTFEQKRHAFLGNPVAAGFLEAQESIHNLRDTVMKYVTRTFELGRLPGPEDFSSCGCGSGCGCG